MGIQERKERERERRRQQIMVAANRIFSEKGFGDAAMEDIAHKAELSPATLHLYFRNKEELYVSLLLRILQYFLLRVEHVSSLASAGPGKKIEALMEAMLDVYELDQPIIIDIFDYQSRQATRNLTPELMGELKELKRRIMRPIEQIFRDGVSEGLFVDRNPAALADTFLSLFPGVILWVRSEKVITDGKDNIYKTLELAFDLFCRGIRAWSHR